MCEFYSDFVQLKVEHSVFLEKCQHSPSKSGQVTLFTAASVSPLAEVGGGVVKWSLNPLLTSVIPGVWMRLLMEFSSLTNWSQSVWAPKAAKDSWAYSQDAVHTTPAQPK